ncbi:hypothetical protein PGR6_42680 [Pseudomonas sp. GR 6-02]|nr:hypothetical protein PGR6_42680 [Pseudomonas sp. GR 6-02]
MSAQKILEQAQINVWRGGLSERRIAPFGCEAVVNPLHTV